VERFGEMDGLAAGCLFDLFAATEPVSDDQRVVGGFSHRRQQHELSHLHRDIVVIVFEPEASGHSATSRIDDVQVVGHIPHERFFIVDRGNRLVMTMAMQHHRLREPRRLVPGHELSEEVRQEIRLTGQSLCVWIVRKQIHELVAKDGKAAWLQHHNRSACAELVTQRLENFQQQAPGLREKSVVVERSPTTERTIRDRDVAAGRFEDFGRGDRRARTEKVIERIGPDQHVLSARAGRRRAPARSEPVDKRSAGQPRNRAAL